MNIKNLRSHLESADLIAANHAAASEKVAAIKAEKDTVIAEATGPDDGKALERLNVLASQESMAHHQLSLHARQLAGSFPAMLNEAIALRADALKELSARRAAIVAKLTKALMPFYGDADRVGEVIEQLNLRNQPPELTRVGKLLTALGNAVFQPKETTEIQYAKLILALSSQAESGE
jgi:hypothetical protein